MQKEIWKDISGYEGMYQVSNLGNILSLERLVKSNQYNDNKRIQKSRIKNKRMNKQGYSVVNLYRDNEFKSAKVHRLIAIAFIPNPENKPCINHKDGNKLNNSIGNLEWCTISENNQHAYDSGLKVGAFKGKFGKENIKSIPVLRIDKNSGEVLQEYAAAMEAARKTRIPQGNITNVCNGKRKIAGGFKWRFKD